MVLFRYKIQLMLLTLPLIQQIIHLLLLIQPPVKGIIIRDPNHHRSVRMKPTIPNIMKLHFLIRALWPIILGEGVKAQRFKLPIPLLKIQC